MKHNHDISDYIDLDATPYQVVLEIFDAANNWEWHPALGPAPEGWDEMQDIDKQEYSTAICVSIESIIGLKAILRDHHKREYGRTDQQFEDWWDSRDDTKELLERFYGSGKKAGEKINDDRKKCRRNRHYYRDLYIRCISAGLIGCLLTELGLRCGAESFFFGLALIALCFVFFIFQ